MNSGVLNFLKRVATGNVAFTASTRLLGRYTAGAGSAQEIKLGSGLSIAGDTLSASGAVDSLPPGGATGQFLFKQSGSNYDADWQSLTANSISDASSAGKTLLTANTVELQLDALGLDDPGGFVSASAVLIDRAQALEAGEKEQARGNIGITLSSGGAGPLDAGAVPIYAAGGDLVASNQVTIIGAESSETMGMVVIPEYQRYIRAFNGLFGYKLIFPDATAAREMRLPDASGTLLLNDGSNVDVDPFLDALGPPPGPFASDDLAQAYGVEVNMPYRGVDGQIHWVQDTETYPTINKLALLGDSITEPTSAVGGGLTSYQAFGWGTALRFSLSQRIELGQRVSTGEYDYGIAGAMASHFAAAGAHRSVFTAVRDSDADTVALMIGSNDMASGSGNLTAEAVAPTIIGLWDELIAAGKSVVAIAPPPRRASASDAATFLARRLALIELLKAAAASRAVQVIDPAPGLDLDGDGYADTNMTSDVVHPNMTGAIRMGRYIAASLSGRGQGSLKVTIPAEGNSAWVTANPYMSGTPGVGNTATGLSTDAFVTARELIARTDGIAGNWQEVTTSGMQDADILRAGPIDVSSLYLQSSGTQHNIGDTLQAVAEVELGSTYWLGSLNLIVDGTVRTQDYSHAAALQYVTAKPPAIRGIMATPPWEASVAATARAQVLLYGNGTARIGRLGIYKVFEMDPDAVIYINGVISDGGTVTPAKARAVSNLYTAEKAGGRFNTKIKELELPVWGNAAANTRNLMAAGSGTWNGGVTHGAGYAQGNGTTGYFSPILTPVGAGMSTSSGYMGILCTQAPSGTGFAAFGGINGATDSLQLYSTGNDIRASMNGAGNVMSWNAGARALHVGIISILRTSTAIAMMRRRISSGATTVASTFADVSANSTSAVKIRFMDQNVATIPSDARIGAMFQGGGGMTAQDDLDFTANLKTCWEAVTGLALP